MKFRGQPIEVEAVRWTGDNLAEIRQFTDHDFVYEMDPEEKILMLSVVKHGYGIAYPGDWIIRGVLGHCYVCEAEAFTKSYIPLEAS